MEIATIGFTHCTAENFFGRLASSGLATLVDVRLNRASQLSGFAKAPDIGYFAARLASMQYVSEPLLAPTPDALNGYRAKLVAWDTYAEDYLAELDRRAVADALDRDLFGRGVVLLCSEAAGDRCHRRLAAEYLARAWGDVVVRHL